MKYVSVCLFVVFISPPMQETELLSTYESFIHDPQMCQLLL